MFLILLLVISSILLSILLISRRKFDYWKKRNVKHLKPVSFLGNYGDYILQKKTVGEALDEICAQFKDEPVIGTFFGTEPALIVQDPEFIKLVTTKDYYYFSSRENQLHIEKEPITKNMFFQYGDEWKVMRQNFTPLFSSAKMKNMFHLIKQCSFEFEDMLDRETKMNNVVEIRSIMSRYTMDCITICAFGVNAKLMSEGEVNPFKRIGDAVFDNSFLRGAMSNLRTIWPSIFYGLGLRLFPKQITDFFEDVIQKILIERQGRPSTKQDFIDLIMAFKENSYIEGDSLKPHGEGAEKVKVKVNDELLSSLCTLFFSAGYETSATTASFTLYELAKHPEIQQKVLDEIDAYVYENKNDLAYDCVTKLPFVEQCVDETLRLYPVLALLTREVTEPYKLPNGLVLEKGLRIHLPLYTLHRNPKYYPEPEKYDPTRFSPENKNNNTAYTYMPFGEGPRICIGKRFARMQMYAGLVTLLKKYKVELAPGMSRNLKFNPVGPVTQSASKIQLRLVEREGWESRRFKRN